jgi:septal ring factor EnvC (AmiA/AmiB activator)
MNINLSKSKNELKVGDEHETNSMKSEVNDMEREINDMEIKINDKEIKINNMEKLIEAYEQKLNAENTINEDDKRFHMVTLFIPKIF